MEKPHRNLLEGEDGSVLVADAEATKVYSATQGHNESDKDLDNAKFMVSMPLLLEKVVFEGTLLDHIPKLKMEDWESGDHQKFPQLAPTKYLSKVYYEESKVTRLEPVKWVVGFEAMGLVNMLWLSHFTCTNINTICMHHLLTLVHDGCLWLGEPILIIEMLIHQIIFLRYQGLDHA